MNVREKLKSIKIRLNELALYLNVSRPTLYKYLELYENKEIDKIDKKTYDLFKYIESTRGLTKPILMDHLYNEYLVLSDDSLISDIKDLMNKNNELNEKKIQIIKIVLKYKNLKEVIERINEIYGA